MKITIHSEPVLKPCQALIIYRDGDNEAAVLHPVRDNGELGAGKALNMADLEELFRSANGRSSLNYLPANVLALSNGGIVWHEASRKHKIFFETTEESRKKLNDLSGREVAWPPLLFALRNSSLYCWALQSDQRPLPQTKLYIAPLTHINEKYGNVCTPSGLGLNNAVSLLEKVRLVSENFYNGVFGHGTGSMRQIAHPGGHDGFWIEYLEKRKHNHFPVELLKPAGKTLEDIL